MSFCPVAEIGFTVTSERDPGRFEHVKSYIFHVPYALIRLVHVDATITARLMGCQHDNWVVDSTTGVEFGFPGG